MCRVRGGGRHLYVDGKNRDRTGTSPRFCWNRGSSFRDGRRSDLFPDGRRSDLFPGRRGYRGGRVECDCTSVVVLLCVLLSIENLLWTKLRDYAISRVHYGCFLSFIVLEARNVLSVWLLQKNDASFDVKKNAALIDASGHYMTGSGQYFAPYETGCGSCFSHGCMKRTLVCSQKDFVIVTGLITTEIRYPLWVDI